MKKDKKITEKKTEVEDTMQCNDKKCPIHGKISVRGRRFKGNVIKIHASNVTIEFQRFTYFPKYERYAKNRTRLHAHLPKCLASQVKVGDYIEIGECRPLSKTIHHVIINTEKSDK